MHDKLVDFIEKHRILTFILIFFILFFLILCVLRAVNMSKKNKDVNTFDTVTSEEYSESDVTSEDEEEIDDEEEQSEYQSELSITARQEEEEKEKEEARLAELEKRRQAEEEQKRVAKARKNMKPTYGDEVICWDSDGVPDLMVDGSSCKAYYKGVSISDFGSMWGKKLTNDDKFTTDFCMIGVDQNPKDVIVGRDNQSLGWLVSNYSKLSEHTAIKFTDLNTIGSLSKSHVALLCSYDWYSAFGMENTLVFFEDISDTLKKSNFKSGTIFSAVVYKHNVKIKNVNGQTVVCVQYNTFK